MSHVILVTYSGYIKTPSSLALDNGLANLAGALIHAGHEVLIEDYNRLSILEKMTPPGISEMAAEAFKAGNTAGADSFARIRELQDKLDSYQERVVGEIFEDLSRLILQHRTSVIGFKCWGSDGAAAVKRWCELIRGRFPELKILLGGSCCSVAPEHTARYIGNFDLMAIGEAEESILGMLEHFEGRRALSEVSGVLYRDPRVPKDAEPRYIKNPPALLKDLDQLPYPNYSREVYPSAWTGEKLNMVVLDESRGCPVQCNFCVHPTYAGSWRVKSAARIVEEIKAIQSLMGTRYFRLAGSNTPPSVLKQMARRVLDEGIDMRFSCFLHVNSVKSEDLPPLREAGLRCVFYGIESADDRLLKEVANKKTNADRMYRVTKATTEQRIFTTGSFIYPMPFETPESREKTVTFIKDLFGGNAYASAQFLNPAPMPDTEWWRERRKYGFEFNDAEYILKMITSPVRHMFPPELQELLPYRLQGKTHRDLANELGALIAELKNDKVIYNISDDVAIIAHGCGMHPSRLKDELLPAFMFGDLQKIRKMIEDFNAKRCRSERPFATFKEPNRRSPELPLGSA